uniref:Uncharacterized protein n=1 Tax=Lygus hesperus TaxID=30085 RepID=A0A0K8TEM7_LYGHE
MDRISYRQLQAFAKVMKLPGNMKYQVLWELVQARRSGNERLVSQLIAEQNRIRVNRRLSRKVAKIQAEALERLIRQEENNNAASPYNMNHANNTLHTARRDSSDDRIGDEILCRLTFGRTTKIQRDDERGTIL